jgi:hypothetical protein
MTLRSIVIAIATFASLVVVSTPCRAEENFLAAVIAQLPQATVSLDQALKTSESEGTPLSAEYDVDDGELQISVYTKKGDEFEEVVIDAKSGSIKSTKPLSEPAEVIEAQAQSAALDKSKLSLTAALDTAVSANSGYRTVSIIPTLDDNEAVANITLLRGDNLKQVAEKLD